MGGGSTRSLLLSSKFLTSKSLHLFLWYRTQDKQNRPRLLREISEPTHWEALNHPHHILLANNAIVQSWYIRPAHLGSAELFKTTKLVTPKHEKGTYCKLVSKGERVGKKEADNVKGEGPNADQATGCLSLHFTLIKFTLSGSEHLAFVLYFSLDREPLDVDVTCVCKWVFQQKTKACGLAVVGLVSSAFLVCLLDLVVQ